jgi:hypothetical protein
LPESIEQLRHDAWSKGWDSLEGALLDQLGIKDEECNGIENVIKDLVNRCKGFKAWRTYHVARRKR